MYRNWVVRYLPMCFAFLQATQAISSISIEMMLVPCKGPISSFQIKPVMWQCQNHPRGPYHFFLVVWFQWKSFFTRILGMVRHDSKMFRILPLGISALPVNCVEGYEVVYSCCMLDCQFIRDPRFKQWTEQKLGSRFLLHAHHWGGVEEWITYGAWCFIPRKVD